MNQPGNHSEQEAASALPLPGADAPDSRWGDSSIDRLTDRRLSVVRSRLTANLGHALASWFHIVPSDHNSAELSTVALLLAAHLPILVPVNDLEAGPVFFVPRYDAQGRRLTPGTHREHLTAYSSLADALLAADTGFQELKAQAHVQTPGRHRRGADVAAELPEETWLRHQLSHRTPSAEANA